MKSAAALPDFSAVTVLVAGDVMLDRYYLGPVQRISREAPVQIVSVTSIEKRPGGAANAAANIAALGARVILTGLVGDDADARTLERLLSERDVECHFIAVPGSPTIVKSRVMSSGQQLLRFDLEDRFPKAPLDTFADTFMALLSRVDVVVLSDYAKGSLEHVEHLIELARNTGKYVFIDPKRDSFSCYTGASVLTPNFAEFMAVAGDCADEATLERKGEVMRRQLGLDSMLVTRGADGISLMHAGGAVHLPAIAHEVYDVTGAGDTVLAVLAVAHSAGMTMVEAARLANYAAGLVVEKVGAATITVEDLHHRLVGMHEKRGIHDEAKLMELVAAARRRGENIVMTNGCFDILHVGHIDYLMRAADLGDRLLVAVNDDASVRRLKGDSRPVNGLAERMRLLAGLEAVDWVTSFVEDTPQRLIERIMPDVLVKGGDYCSEEIVGHDSVIACGGKVMSLKYLDGYSTSSIIAGIRNAKV